MANILLFCLSCALLAAFAWYFTYLGQAALTAWIAMLSLLANFFVLKQISLLGFNSTASECFAIGGLLSLNLLQEKFGARATQQAIYTSFACLLFFALFSQIHLYYEPSEYDHSQASYLFLLGSTPRIIFASLVTFFLVQQFDKILYAKLRQVFNKAPILFISAISMCCSQFLDTVLFIFLGLYGLMDAIVQVILITYAIKLLAIASTIPFAMLTKRIFVKTP